MPEYAVGLALGGTNLRAAAIDRSGKMLDKISGATELLREAVRWNDSQGLDEERARKNDLE